MKEFLTIIGIFIALFFTYHLVWFLIFKRTFKPVLMYHRITDEEKPIDIRYQMHKGKQLNLDSMKVRPSEFESQLKYLKQKGFITPSLREDLFKIKDKAVYMTFDDGYVDNYTNAFPRLQKYDFKGIFYITAGLIENGFMPIDQNDQQVSNRLMNHEELNILNRAGMQIGSHSMTHPWLDASGIDLNIEIVQSKLILEEKLGIQIDTFAYPGGLYDNEVLNLVKKQYQTAVITSRGSDFKLMNQDLFEIERETISRGESMLSFKLKVYGVHRFIRKLRWLNVLRRVIKWLLRRS